MIREQHGFEVRLRSPERPLRLSGEKTFNHAHRRDAGIAEFAQRVEFKH